MQAFAVTDMIDYASAEPPIAIDRVERARGQGDDVRLRLSGHWLIDDPPSQPDAPEALLVIQLQGRRHRFPADRSPAGAAPLPGTWQAEFTVPSWAVPSRRGQAAVWVGTSVIAVGPPGMPPAPVPPPDPEAASPEPAPVSPEPAGVSAEPVAVAPESSEPAAVLPEPAAESAEPATVSPQSASPGPEAAAVAEPGGSPDPRHDPGRGGPLASLLLKETVSALHAELERRSTEAAQLRGALADAQSELDARAARQAGLESAHGELRHELEQLMAAATRQRQDFEQRLAAVRDELDRAREDAAMATAARDETETQLAQAREQAKAELAQAREQARAELARAREQAGALEERLRARTDAEHREAHEAAALREQLASAQISRDAAISEAGGLRAELERLGAELTVMREQVSAHGGDLGEAQRLLADARALTQQLRGGGAAS
jgi:hypothetical protein